MSEVASCRQYLVRFCTGTGLDLGFGGDPIKPDSITVDKNPYTRPSFLGDISNLTWFKDDSFDYLFSSHALEDFEDTSGVLREWFRVLKPGGNMVLFLPDEKVYQAHCAKNGSLPNQAHKHKDFSFEYVMKCLDSIPRRLIHMEDPVTYNPYSFSICLQKP